MSRAACKITICQDLVGTTADGFCEDAVAGVARTASSLAKQIAKAGYADEAIVAAELFASRAHAARVEIQDAAEDYLDVTNHILDRLTDDIG